MTTAAARTHPPRYSRDAHDCVLPYQRPTGSRPSWDEIEAMVRDYLPAEATDGCHVEPDGACCHGHVSWLVFLGLA